jgi:large subunit ribosomal protein L31
MMLLVGNIRRPNFASTRERPDMKPEIHPEYNTVKATCSCGNVIEVGSTMADDIHLEVCSACHPFYTGKQKSIDSGGRVERFRQRFGNRGGAGNKSAEGA